MQSDVCACVEVGGRGIIAGRIRWLFRALITYKLCEISLLNSKVNVRFGCQRMDGSSPACWMCDDAPLSQIQPLFVRLLDCFSRGNVD